MITPTLPENPKPDQWSDAEWRLRIELAAAYRLVDHFGWTELIYGHLTAHVPGEEPHFLINPYGLNYDEVTASNLVKIDVDGSIVGAGIGTAVGLLASGVGAGVGVGVGRGVGSKAPSTTVRGDERPTRP